MARGSPGGSNPQQSPWLWTESVFHCALGDTSQPPREAAVARRPTARGKLIAGLNGSQWSYTGLMGHPNTKMSIMGTGSFPTACQQHGQGRAATGTQRFGAAQPLASPKGSRDTCVGTRKRPWPGTATARQPPPPATEGLILPAPSSVTARGGIRAPNLPFLLRSHTRVSCPPPQPGAAWRQHQLPEVQQTTLHGWNDVHGVSMSHTAGDTGLRARWVQCSKNR